MDYNSRLDYYEDLVGLTHIRAEPIILCIDQDDSRTEERATFDIRLSDNLVTFRYPSNSDLIIERIVPEISLDMRLLELMDALVGLIREEFSDRCRYVEWVSGNHIDKYPSDISWTLEPTVDEDRAIIHVHIFDPQQYPERNYYYIDFPATGRGTIRSIELAPTIAEVIEHSMRQLPGGLKYDSRINYYKQFGLSDNISVRTFLRYTDSDGVEREDPIDFRIGISDNIVTYEHPGHRGEVFERFVPEIDFDMTPRQLSSVLRRIALEDLSDDYSDMVFFYPDPDLGDHSNVSWIFDPDPSRPELSREIRIPIRDGREDDSRYTLFGWALRRDNGLEIEQIVPIRDVMESAIVKFQDEVLNEE